MGSALLKLFATGPGSQVNAPKITPEQQQVNAALATVKLVELAATEEWDTLLNADLATAIPGSQKKGITGAQFAILVEQFRSRLVTAGTVIRLGGAYRVAVKNWGQNAPPNMSEEQWKAQGTPFPDLPMELDSYLAAIDVTS